jgi:predicted RNA-binding Zn ribbon-like protein
MASTRAPSRPVGSAELALSAVRLPPERQPGGRRPAPWPLALVQAFVNTFWDIDRHGADRLADPRALSEWLASRRLVETGLRFTRADLRLALDAREGLRALLLGNNGAAPDARRIEGLNTALRAPELFVKLRPSGPPDLAVERRGLDGALALIAGAVAVAQIDGTWWRLKACRGEHCGWAFYDHSRNQASNWCSMSVCGARAKARRYRRRRRPASPAAQARGRRPAAT